MKELIEIQTLLVAKKNQYNSFGKYSYRNCEDILEALKPHLKKLKCFVVVKDELKFIGDRFYIEATATITNSEGLSVSTSALAREADTKKGMDVAQITGATSSYARKYALNGLFAIDDNKDPDHGNAEPEKAPELITDAQLKKLNTLMTNTGIDKEQIYKRYGVTSLKQLWKSTANEAINGIENMINKNTGE